MKRRVSAIAGVVVVAMSACAGGGADSDRAAEPTVIEVTMGDNSFTPQSLVVKRGQKVTLRFTNEGAVTHEALIGSEATQVAHGREMKEMADAGQSMDHHGGDGAASGGPIAVEPGDSADLSFVLESAGELLIGCHEPGHYEAGMKADLRVT